MSVVSTYSCNAPLFPAGAIDADKAKLCFEIGRFWARAGYDAVQAEWQAAGNRFWMRASGFDPDASEAAGRPVKLRKCAGCETEISAEQGDASIKGLSYHPACAAAVLFGDAKAPANV